MKKRDFIITNHGSICILNAMTKRGERWVDANIGEDAMTWGCNGIVVEPRYVPDIVNGIRDDGLTVN